MSSSSKVRTTRSTTAAHRIGFDDVRHTAQEADGRYHVCRGNASGDTIARVSAARVRHC